MRTLLLFALLVSSCFAQIPENATVRVYTYTDENRFPDYWGSGVLVSNTQVLTNCHVVRKRRKEVSVTVRFSDGYRSDALVEFENKGKDVALLKITPHPTFQPMEFGTDVEYDEEVEAYGYTYDYEFVRTTNRMWHRRSGEVKKGGVKSDMDVEGYWFAIVGKMRVPGDSGGPVVKDNKIVGIIQSIGKVKEEATGLNKNVTLCVRVDAILELIEDKIKPELKIK